MCVCVHVCMKFHVYVCGVHACVCITDCLYGLSIAEGDQGGRAHGL